MRRRDRSPCRSLRPFPRSLRREVRDLPHSTAYVSYLRGSTRFERRLARPLDLMAAGPAAARADEAKGWRRRRSPHDLDQLLATRAQGLDPVERRVRQATFDDVLHHWFAADCPNVVATRRRDTHGRSPRTRWATPATCSDRGGHAVHGERCRRLRGSRPSRCRGRSLAAPVDDAARPFGGQVADLDSPHFG